MNQSKKVFVVDSQKLNSIQSCIRKYQYAFMQNREEQAPQIQFEKGELIHLGLEFYYKSRQVKYKWEENGITHAHVVQQSIDFMRKRAVEMHTDVEELEDVIRIFIEYCSHYHNDGWDDIISVEKVASKVLYEDSSLILMYEGKVDLIVGLNISGQRYPIPVDHKSYSRKYPVSDMNNQFLGYVWLMDSNYIEINLIGFQTSVKPSDKFIRELLYYSPERINEWKDNTIFSLRQAIAYIDNNLFPMNLTSCNGMYNKGCQFRQVCQSNLNDRQDKLIQLYQEREKQWDVGKHLE